MILASTENMLILLVSFSLPAAEMKTQTMLSFFCNQRILSPSCHADKEREAGEHVFRCDGRLWELWKTPLASANILHTTSHSEHTTGHLVVSCIQLSCQRETSRIHRLSGCENLLAPTNKMAAAALHML